MTSAIASTVWNRTTVADASDETALSEFIDTVEPDIQVLTKLGEAGNPRPESLNNAIRSLELLAAAVQGFLEQQVSLIAFDENGEPNATESALLLTGLRACQTANEMATLMKAGLAVGTWARWRGLFESRAIAMTLALWPEFAGDRFWLGTELTIAQLERDFAYWQRAIGDDTDTNRTAARTDRANRNRTEAIKELARSAPDWEKLDHDAVQRINPSSWDWTRGLIPNPPSRPDQNVSFTWLLTGLDQMRDIETPEHQDSSLLANGKLRPLMVWYRVACQAVHGGWPTNLPIPMGVEGFAAVAPSHAGHGLPGRLAIDDIRVILDSAASLLPEERRRPLERRLDLLRQIHCRGAVAFDAIAKEESVQLASAGADESSTDEAPMRRIDQIKTIGATVYYRGKFDGEDGGYGFVVGTVADYKSVTDAEKEWGQSWKRQKGTIVKIKDPRDPDEIYKYRHTSAIITPEQYEAKTRN